MDSGRYIVNIDNFRNHSALISEFEFVQKLPGFIFVKDANFRFLNITQNSIKYFGWKEPEQSILKTDYEVPCGLADHADTFRSDDEKIIATSKELLSLQIYECACGWRKILVHKIPILTNNSELLGIYCAAMDVSSCNIFKWQQLMHHDKKIINVNKPSRYILSEDFCPLPLLTIRQQEVVFLLIRGMVFKEIAYILGMSPRTAEDHIKAIKYRLKCNTKGQIIEKAISKGFLYYIPKRFIL